ncbi:lyase family protein [Elusimicrobiota bacterium]
MKTKPRPKGIDARTNPALLVAGRYATKEMIDIWGVEKTFEFILNSQVKAVETISKLYPKVVARKQANQLKAKANLKSVRPARIRAIEEKTGHDVIAINTAWGETVPREAASHINKARTSADSTETAKALQIKQALEIMIDSLENLRDIIIEKAMEFDVPFMDTTHLYDAMPTMAGRPFMFYVEMLESDLQVLNYFYRNSIKGKWADATGNHHSAVALGMDGMRLQENYCKSLGLGCMIAPAQVPGREFISDIFYALARFGETLRNLATYVAWGKSDDVDVFCDLNPTRRKGSSAMPHKDAKGGNPTIEERTKSLSNILRGYATSALSACAFPYARDLSASASDRIMLESAFKLSDCVIRDLANTVYWLGLKKQRSIDRIKRTFGIVTSSQVAAYLTDRRTVKKPMSRKDAHDLMGQLATKAYGSKRNFFDVLAQEHEVTSRISYETLRKITDPVRYIGQSREILRKVYKTCYKKKTLPFLVSRREP